MYSTRRFQTATLRTGAWEERFGNCNTDIVVRGFGGQRACAFRECGAGGRGGGGVAVPSSQVILVVTVCTLGQMIAKAALYSCARWLPQKLPARAVRHLERASEKAKRIEQAGWGVIAISAFVGLPPFYVISLAAGMVRVNFAAFLVIGFLGRFARFAILAYTAAAAGGAIQGGL